MSWTRKLSSLPGLSEEDKGRAVKLILDRPREDRELYLSGSQEQAVASIRSLITGAPQPTRPEDTWGTQLHSELSCLSSRDMAHALLLFAAMPADVRSVLLSCGTPADRVALVRALIKQPPAKLNLPALSGSSTSNVMCTIS